MNKSKTWFAWQSFDHIRSTISDFSTPPLCIDFTYLTDISLCPCCNLFSMNSTRIYSTVSLVFIFWVCLVMIVCQWKVSWMCLNYKVPKKQKNTNKTAICDSSYAKCQIFFHQQQPRKKYFVMIKGRVAVFVNVFKALYSYS